MKNIGEVMAYPDTTVSWFKALTIPSLLQKEVRPWLDASMPSADGQCANTEPSPVCVHETTVHCSEEGHPRVDTSTRSK